MAVIHQVEKRSGHRSSSSRHNLFRARERLAFTASELISSTSAISAWESASQAWRYNTSRCLEGSSSIATKARFASSRSISRWSGPTFVSCWSPGDKAVCLGLRFVRRASSRHKLAAIVNSHTRACRGSRRRRRWRQARRKASCVRSSASCASPVSRSAKRHNRGTCSSSRALTALGRPRCVESRVARPAQRRDAPDILYLSDARNPNRSNAFPHRSGPPTACRGTYP